MTVKSPPSSNLPILYVGFTVELIECVNVVSGAYVGYDGANPLTYDVGARVKLRDVVWAGLSYRNTNSVAGMAGYLSIIPLT